MSYFTERKEGKPGDYELEMHTYYVSAGSNKQGQIIKRFSQLRSLFCRRIDAPTPLDVNDPSAIRSSQDSASLSISPINYNPNNPATWKAPPFSFDQLRSTGGFQLADYWEEEPILVKDRKQSSVALNLQRIRTGGAANNLPPFGADFLTRYIDIHFGKHGRMYLFQKRYTTTLASFIPFDATISLSQRMSEKTIWKLVVQILYGLIHLNCFNEGAFEVIHGNLSPESIFLLDDERVKVGDYGHSFLAQPAGYPFPIGHPNYLAPELIATMGSQSSKTESKDRVPLQPNVDTWALGLILLEILEGQRLFSQSAPVAEILNKALERLGHNPSGNPSGLKDMVTIEQQKRSFVRWVETKLQSLFTYSPSLLEFIRICLDVDGSSRPSPKELLSWIELNDITVDLESRFASATWVPKVRVDSAFLDFSFLDSQPTPANLALADINLDNLGKSALRPAAPNPSQTSSLFDPFSFDPKNSSGSSSSGVPNSPNFAQAENSPLPTREITTRDWLYQDVGREAIVALLRRAPCNAFLVKPGRPICELYRWTPASHALICVPVPVTQSGFYWEKSGVTYPTLEMLVAKVTELRGYVPVKIALQEAQPLSVSGGNLNVLSGSASQSGGNSNQSNNGGTASNNGVSSGPPATDSAALLGVFKALCSHPLADTSFETELLRICPGAKFPPAIRRLPTTVVRVESADFAADTTIPRDATALCAATPLRIGREGLMQAISALQQRLKTNTENPSAYADVDLSNRIPLHVRVKDLHYQRRRIQLFKNLFVHYPASRQEIIVQAKIDIPPFLRALIWAAILHVPANADVAYRQIDFEKDDPTDHQIDLDIPRCHQYHPLLSSNVGHAKMRRVLKAWVEFNRGRLVYWQGLDSILAPFMVLFFEHEAIAFYCLQAFVQKFLHNMFLQDNHLYLQEHLSIFTKLLCYHEPALAVHLDKIEFFPSLYAVPWFLTLFTHTLKLDKIMQMWDSIMVNANTLQFFMAISIMRQFRNSIIGLDFNDCVSFFADKDLPIDVHRVSEEALAMFSATPIKSAFQNTKLSLEDESKSDDLACDEPMLEGGLLISRITGREYQDAVAKYVVRTFDIRSPDEFKKKHLPNSVNIKDWKKIDIGKLSTEKGHYIAIVGPSEQDSTQFGLRLLHAGWPYVSLLKIKDQK